MAAPSPSRLRLATCLVMVVGLLMAVVLGRPELPGVERSVACCCCEVPNEQATTHDRVERLRTMTCCESSLGEAPQLSAFLEREAEPDALIAAQPPSSVPLPRPPTALAECASARGPPDGAHKLPLFLIHCSQLV